MNSVGFQVNLADTAASCSIFVKEIILLSFREGIVNGLWEFVYSLIVARVVCLSFSSNVLNTICPCVNRGAPITAALSSNVVRPSHDTEKSFFSPMRPPAISEAPERGSVFLTPTYKSNFVYCVEIACLIIVNTTCVVI